MLFCAFVGTALAQGSTTLVRVSHDGWVVTAQNQYGSASGNEGGLDFIADENPQTFYHSDWSGNKDGQNGTQGFLVEMAESVSDICKITYAGRSDNNASGWASKVRIYVYDELPAELASLSNLNVGEKNALFANNEVLGTPVFNNSENPWDKDDKQMKTAEFSPVTGKYILFIQDEGKDNWLTCSDFQVYYQFRGATCTVKYEFYYNDEKKLTQETPNIVVGSAWPAITTTFPYGVNVPTAPTGNIASSDVVEGVATKRFDLSLGELPFSVSTLTDGAFGDGMSWYFLKMRSKDVTYDAASGMAKAENVVYKTINNLFAFTGNPFDGYSIYNYAAGADKVFWRADASNGGRVFFTNSAETNGNTWVLSKNGSGYVFRLNGYTTGYMNDHQPEIAIWNSGAGATDAGSTFAFEYVENIDAVAVDGLRAYVAEVEAEVKAYNDNGVVGNTVGNISSESVEKVVEALAAAKTAVGNETGCVAAQKTLEAAVAAVEMIMPEEGKFYKIVSACTKDHRAGQDIYVKNDGNMHFAKSDEYGLGVASAWSRVWQFVPAANGKFYLKNVERGVFMKSVGVATETASANAKAVTISNMGLGNRVSLKPDGQSQMHAQDNNSKVVGWDENNPTDGSAWIITEVSIDDLAHTVIVGEVGWATLVLGYNAEIPDGVEAYAVSSTEEGVAKLTSVKDVLAAGEAVLLKNAGTYDFKYTSDDAEDVENLLEGTTIDMDIEAEAYVLGNVNGVGFYTAAFNASTDKDNDGTEEAPNVTYEAFKNNAFKAYLPKAAGASLTLRFNFGETTGIEGVIESTNANAAIFDLSGRRVAKMQKGIYIVNGKKVYVK